MTADASGTAAFRAWLDNRLRAPESEIMDDLVDEAALIFAHEAGPSAIVAWLKAIAAEPHSPYSLLDIESTTEPPTRYLHRSPTVEAKAAVQAGMRGLQERGQA